MLTMFPIILDQMNKKASREYWTPCLNKERIVEHVSNVEAKITREVNTLEINLGSTQLLEQTDKSLN